MSEHNDPNLGGGLVGSEDEVIAGWAENDFNLLDYIGKDESPADYDELPNSYNPEEDEMREKDRYYSALQYNNVMLSGDDQFDNYPNTPMYAQPHMNHNYYDTSFNQENMTLIPSTSRNSSTVQTPTQVKIEPIKTEVYEDDALKYEDAGYNQYARAESESSYQSSSTARNKPRKYRIKPDSEKRNPMYRAKREKNNDAVRRSRDKAKREQEKRDMRLRDLETEIMRKNSQIKLLDNRVQSLQQLVKTQTQQLQGCTCRRNMNVR
ncbi:basic region leucine zipper domain-containing protein [Ditylenchus destructor]|uniref:Basic region leucine zipper domain-containing protein n=1 Tax=Ditylenchus destructor TaxID=166010 RepID=A0AAD4MKT8_9BILA|nr:basic region leucine zipper domain-containing protein [Ditylenchus destructor]